MLIKNLQTVQDRLPIYEEVLSFLKSNKGQHPVWATPINVGLCILLPCAWNKIHWENDFRDSYGDVFHFNETFTYFPEIEEYYYKGCTKYCGIYKNDAVAWRIKILEEIIEKYTMVTYFDSTNNVCINEGIETIKKKIENGSNI